MPTESDPAAVAGAIAARLLGGAIDAIAAINGNGRNSRIYRVRHAGADFALKHYLEATAGGRQRLEVELAALTLMTENGIGCVPAVIGADRERGYVLLEWIAGDVVSEPCAAEIDAACDFLSAVHQLRRAAAAAAQPLAAEACLSGAEIMAQIERRLVRLRGIPDEPQLADFLERRMAPLATEIGDWAAARYAAGGLAFAAPLPRPAQSLCPSDFGFHNALRTPSGRLVFIDFDYFGWDDPAKLVCDFLLHPGMRLGDAAKHRFAAGMTRVYGSDPGFARRLPLLYPLFALRWCLILLNEFLPERWAYRRHAGVAADWTAAKRRQLDRAAEWVQSLSTNFKRFPYGE